MEDLRSWVRNGGKSGGSKRLAISLSVSASAVALILVTLLGVFLFRRRLKTKQRSEGFNDLISDMAPTRYSYSQIKKFSNNFAIKIGEGGFGSAYKGIIKDSGREIPVAIKLLKKSKQSEKQFMTEVATVGRLHHTNLVRMLGYCVHNTDRALVYEFMENGSLDRYIYKPKKQGEEEEEDTDRNFTRLSVKQMYTIALETARGILYLHESCRSRILHCDIKPHNVLLDSNFSAKVADFGLAKITDKEPDQISLTRGQGTPGYAAPEIWLRSYGPVTEKSDVYSFGMLILEMANGRRNYDSFAPASSQVYFPKWAFCQVENGTFETEGISSFIGIRDGSEEDKETVKNMCMVGLWCIQHIPSNRPTMGKVIQMLEGNAEIETPPNPFPTDSEVPNTSDFITSTSYVSSRKETTSLTSPIKMSTD